MTQKILGFLITVVFVCFGQTQSNQHSSVQKMVFEEQRIEGKIRRPQLVLIQAEQRPVFEPMVLQSLGKSGDMTASVDRSVIDDIPNRVPFQFEGTRIVNIVP